MPSTLSHSVPHPDLDPPAPQDRIGDRDVAHWRTPLGRMLANAVVAAGGCLGIGPAVSLVLGVGLAVFVVFAFAATRVYDAVVERDGVAGLDMPALHAAMRWRSPGLDRAVTLFTDIGGPTWMPVFSTVLAVAIALTWRTWLPILMTIAATIGSLAMTIAGKDVVGRVRPPHVDAVPPYETSPSFPSGHTLNTTVVLGVLTYVLLTRLRSRVARNAVVVVAVVWTLAMGLSRVFLGHHWLTDVAMGWVLGAAWVAVIVTAHRVWVTARRAQAARGS